MKDADDVVQKSLALLKEERELFDKAIAFQLAAIESVTRDTPMIEDGLRAAVAIACYTHDMLLCGWESLIHGFYSVAFHSIRSIDQATVTEVAVMINPKIAQKFWKDKLTDGDASKALQRAIEAEDPDFGEGWGKRRRHIRKLFSKFMHLSRTAISPSISIADDLQSATLRIGGFFIEKRCHWIGRLYANLAFNAAVNASQAFKTVLPPDGKLAQQLDRLVEWGRPVIDNWEREMGFL